MKTELPLFLRTSASMGRRGFLTLAASAAAMPLMRGRAMAYATDTFTTTFGSAEVVMLSDGHLTLPTALLVSQAGEDERTELLTQAFGSADEMFNSPANITLIKTGSDIVLVDNGSGNKFQPTAGRLLDNLAANGIDPASITKVFLTHAHPDHAWGTTLDSGALAFPNAEYILGETEHVFWTDPDLPSKMPAEVAPFAIGAQKELAAVRERITLVKDGGTVAPGVSAIDTPGHTPGHMSLLVEGGTGVVVGGDTIANNVVSLRHPEWIFGFDTLPDVAIATRQRMIDRVTADGHQWIGYHFPYPGLGVIEKAAEGFHFTPA